MLKIAKKICFLNYFFPILVCLFSKCLGNQVIIFYIQIKNQIHFLPMMMGILSILSKANPVKNRLRAKVRRELLNAVKQLPKKPTMHKIVKAGSLPL